LERFVKFLAINHICYNALVMAKFRNFLLQHSFEKLHLQRKSSPRKTVEDGILESVTAYVQANTIAVKDGRKCVDGRYLPEQGTGMIARPGGDCGYVIALDALSVRKKLGLSPEDCFNIVYKAITKNGSRFNMHTDDHVHKGKVSIGCGHLTKAASEKLEKEYDVKSQNVLQIINYACHLSEISQAVDMIELRGGHEEKGVLVIQSDRYTVNADNPKLHQMYFVYDQQRDNAFMKQLVKEMGLKDVTYEDMKHESDMQLQATLQNLAAGLPIFTVTFIGNKPVVMPTGFVEYKPLRKRLTMNLPRKILSLRFSHLLEKN
jgi:hypothetical protein